jgi:signal transduction histidine kinase
MRRPRLGALRPGTLRGRLALTALAVTAAWVAALALAFNLVLAAQLREQADDLLRTRAAAVAATVQVLPGGQVVVHEPANDQALDVGIWIYEAGTAVERPAASTALQVQADSLAGHGTEFVDTPKPNASRLYVLPVTAGGRRQVATVVASVDLNPYQGTAKSVLAGSVALALALLGGVYLVTRLIVGRALRPVGVMSRQAAEWSEHGTARRFGVRGRPAELAGLAGNLDELLGRLAAVLRHEQQLSAELSHELRTPLARITAEIDWLTARPRDTAETLDSHEAIAASAATMRRICDTLLSDARAGAVDTPVPGRCALPEVAAALAARTADAHPEAPAITVRGSAPPAGVSAAVAERILAPLLDNARRYAVQEIIVECVQRPGGIEVSVGDDGPGVPPELGAAVFEAGRRADPTDRHDGAGLGLALARRLARAAGGDLVLADTPDPLGGARFVVSLPAG